MGIGSECRACGQGSEREKMNSQTNKNEPFYFYCFHCHCISKWTKTHPHRPTHTHIHMSVQHRTSHPLFFTTMMLLLPSGSSFADNDPTTDVHSGQDRPMPFLPFPATVYVGETLQKRTKTFLQFPDGQQKLLVTNHRPYLSTPTNVNICTNTHTCLSLGTIPPQTWST